MLQRTILLISFLVGLTLCQTPVIGGTCKLGTADVQIGGKQTQFFLKCETTADSAEGEGVWVVKSRAAASPIPTVVAAAPAPIPVENTQPQQHPKARKPSSPNICEQDNGARENEACAVSATCLQAHNEFPSSYLQCDQTSLRWVRKSCQEGFLFNFEQQTCIVPKRMSSLSPPSTNPCSLCKLGTACRNGQCVQLTTSSLCSDGSPPNGTCFDGHCPNGNFFCTSQKVCCPKSARDVSLGCQLACTIDASCPKGMSCQNNCCEVRKILRHPKGGNSAPLEQSGYDIFDMDSSSLNTIFDHTEKPLDIRIFDVVKPPASQPCLSSNLEKKESALICGGTNANCTSDLDCPTSFKCENNCCRIATCPRTENPVRFTCTTQYHCRSTERCIFGGCCPKNVELAIIAPPSTSMVLSPQKPGIKSEDSCEIDTRVSKCDIDDACPEGSECVEGVCCKLPPYTRCGNGLLALTIPDTCQLSDECPVSSRCEYGKCCPFLTEVSISTSSKKDFQKKQPVLKKTSKVWKKIEEGVSISKHKCLSSSTCNLHKLCPPEFTCSTSGKCCHLNVRCSDGTVPETSCETDENCPSSSHKCVVLENKHKACCYSPGQQASGLLCTFSSCSNSNPCSVGTCNNGYCCSSSSNSAPAIIDDPARRTASTTNNPNITIASTKKKHRKQPVKRDLLAPQDDFPVGPPGYGFPRHLANLDEVLVKATGDGFQCAGGFQSSLVCSIGSADCPAGLHCDTAINLCCPLILPLTDSKNPKKKGGSKKRRKQQQEQGLDQDEMKALKFSSYSGGCGCTMSGGSSNCVGCQSAPQVIAIPQNSCPGGGYSVGGCSSGYCATGYSCVQNQCCPSYNSAPSISIYSCPSGGSAVGACIQGRCASGYQCHNNGCCPQSTTTNPFVCPDGTQAAGGCVNGQCGTGYTCSNGLCCAGTSTTVKCLDGSDAVGACIPSCQGNGCGGVQVSYYCGSGYTCTTGNICCPINSCPNGGEPLGPTINGLCPTGYTVQGNLCCSATCADGSSGIAAVNGVCVTGYTLTNGVCCASSVTCSDEISIGPCAGTGYNGGCQVGYECDSNGVNCCPVVDYTSESCQVGPAIDGLCPPGYVVVYIPNSPLITNGVNPGTCIDIQCTTGICAAANQIGECDQTTTTGTCPTGYTCFTTAGVCCSTTAFSRLRISSKSRPLATNPVYGRPLHSYMPPRFGSLVSSTCSDGSVSSGPCMNGLCGIGLECQNGKCCQPSGGSNNNNGGGLLESKCPSGDTAVSGCFPNGSCGTGYECVSSLNLCCPPGQPSTNTNTRFGGGNSNHGMGSNMSPRPIGARCMIDMECVGHSDGLSMCHAGVCQCSPIAYSQGIACVRRKSFQMNDDPIIDASAATTEDKSISL